MERDHALISIHALVHALTLVSPSSLLPGLGEKGVERKSTKGHSIKELTGVITGEGGGAEVTWATAPYVCVARL